MSTSPSKTQAQRITTILFIAYWAVLFWILVFKMGVQFSYMDERIVNFIPFHQAFESHGRIDFPELILNVLIFLPMGIYSAFAFERWSFGKHLVLFLLSSLFFEGLQFVLRIGAFDITDIVTNTAGGVIGLQLVRMVNSVVANRSRAHAAINVIGAIGTAFMILFLVLLKLDLLPIRYQ